MSGTSLRDEFPILAKRVYLASASLGPLSVRSSQRMESYLTAWERCGPEELWHELGETLLNTCRMRFAELIGVAPATIAIMPSVSVALSAVASCLNFASRPKVVVTDLSFATTQAVWRAQERRGASLDVVPSHDGMSIEIAEIVRAIDERTNVVSIDRVLFESSWLLDLAPVVEKARSCGALVVVDDYHGTGAVPLNATSLGIDFLVSGTMKWLCGGPGVTMLYCREGLLDRMQPLVVGWLGLAETTMGSGNTRPRRHTDGRRFETGTHALHGLAAASGGLDLITEIGVDHIRSVNLELTRLIIDHATDLSLRVLAPNAERSRGGSVRIRLPGGAAGTQVLLDRLLSNDVVVDGRGDTVRIAPHFFNTAADIEYCFATLAGLLGRTVER